MNWFGPISMKIFIKFMIFIVVLGLAGPFIMKGPDGLPLMDYRDFIPDFSSAKSSMQRWWGNVGAQVSSANDAAQSDQNGSDDDGIDKWGKTRVYQWQDENGVWQYTDRPPTGIETKTLWLNPNENIVLSPAQPVSEVADDEDSDAQDPGFELPLPFTVSPAEVPQLIEDAKGVKELMEKRNEMLESVSGKSK